MVNETIPAEGEISRQSLEKLAKAEICNIGRLAYGINMNVNEPKKTLIDLVINAAHKFKGNAEMRVVEMNEEVEVPAGYVKIRVQPGDHNPNARPIIVGLNFKMASIPCNKDVVLHGKWLTCLEDAVETKYSVRKSTETGRDELVVNEQHKYPFSIMVDNR
jgi:hypothetical protein